VSCPRTTYDALGASIGGSTVLITTPENKTHHINLDKYSQNAENSQYPNHLVYMQLRVCFGVDIQHLLTDTIFLSSQTNFAHIYVMDTHTLLPLSHLRTPYDPLGPGAGSATAFISSPRM
jgi:hypothetical protein